MWQNTGFYDEISPSADFSPKKITSTPETSTSLSFGFDYKPESASGNLDELFTIAEPQRNRRFLEKNLLRQKKNYKEVEKFQIRQEIDFNFKVKLLVTACQIQNNIIEQQKQNIDSNLIKEVDSCLEISEDTYKYIFKKQYEKLNIHHSKIMIKISILLDNQFEKEIENKQYETKIPENNQKVNDSLLFSLNQKQYKFGFCLERSFNGQIYLKPYYLQCNYDSIDQIFEIKNSYLNKSELLNKVKKLIELKGIYYPLTKQNMGSRILQKLLCKASQIEIQLFFKQIKNQLPNIIKDQYGNYVFQKLIEKVSEVEKSEILQKLDSRFIELIMTKPGTHSLQKMLGYLNESQFQIIFKNIQNNQLSLICDQFASHFMQKLLLITGNYFLISICLDNFYLISQSRYGILILKQILISYHHNIQIRTIFINRILSNLYETSTSEFGHYLVEECFLFYNRMELQFLFQMIISKLTDYCCNIYSSSIIKRLIDIYQDEFICALAIQINQDQNIQAFMQNSSGSFILHRILEKNTVHSFLIIKSMKQKLNGLENYQKKSKWRKFLSNI